MPVLSRAWISPVRRAPDDCGYRDQARRITDYQIRHTPESVLPFVRESVEEGCHPDGCGVCDKATWWESRRPLTIRPSDCAAGPQGRSNRSEVTP